MANPFDYHLPVASSAGAYSVDHLVDEFRFVQGSSSSIERYDHAPYLQDRALAWQRSHWTPQFATTDHSPVSQDFNPSSNPNSIPPLNLPYLPLDPIDSAPMAIPPQRNFCPPPSSASGSNSGEREPQASTQPARVREKRHACWMCHKSFDRPSTLKKGSIFNSPAPSTWKSNLISSQHLLVHTGEKAFACTTCGRRFGVASNLNRHIRRCVLRPIHGGPSAAAASAAATPATPAAPATDASGASTNVSVFIPDPVPAAVIATSQSPEREDTSYRCRGRTRTTTVGAASGAASPSSASSSSGRAKRRRRAPSPAQWIPPSLKSFDLSPFPKACPVPLTPVLPCQDADTWEERDSYDENPPPNPYHPAGWRGKLPGPGLQGKDVMNMSMAVGRLVLF